MPRRIIVLAVFVVVAMLCSATVAVAADEVPIVRYRPPVPDPIVDRFDPPDKPWLAGNRGIDYATAPATNVSASGDGKVAFAGLVGGALHVTVQHADGLRTTYSFLAEIRVREGQAIRGGDVVGVSGGAFHFGVRTPDGTYLDPEALLAGVLEPRVRLVPGAEEGLDPLVERRSLLETLTGTGIAAVSFVASKGLPVLDLVAHYATELNPMLLIADGLKEARRWWDQQRDCTPRSTPMVPPVERRIAVLVSGLGTTSGANSAFEIDTTALGYEDTDVVRFSYTGGRAGEPPPSGPTAKAATRAFLADPDPDLSDIPVRSFTKADSQQSLRLSADRLAELLTQVAVAEPGVPIDVLAHSQGGVVARLGVVEAGRDATLPDGVENLVTVGSPHQGAAMATTVVANGVSPGGDLLLDEIWASGKAGELDDRLPAINQLSETSDTLSDMRSTPIPEGVRFTSIGGSGDLIVPGTATEDPQADVHVLIPTGTYVAAHGDLTKMEATTREIGLATSGLGPTCESPWRALDSWLQAQGIRTLETGSGAGIAAVSASPLPSAAAVLSGD